MPVKTQTRKANKGKTKRTPRKATAESKSALATPSVVKAATQTVSISKAKGRPMLTWVGKRPLTQVVAFPAQHIETFDPDSDAVRRKEIMWKDWPKAYPHGGLLFHGDNKEVLAHLLANGFRGKVNLIYIDPPFDSGADYIRKVTFRGAAGTAKLDGESYTLGEQIQYTDIWANDNYLQFMYERILMMRELLAENAVIFLHANHERVHLLRCVLDEVLGSENFRNDIIWKRGPGKSHPDYFGRVKDTILFYCKGPHFTWNKQFKALSESYRKTFRKKDEKDYYVTQPLHSGKPAKNVPEWRGVRPPGGRGWAYKIETLEEFDREGLVEWSEDGIPRLKRYLKEVEGAAVQDVWEDIVDSVSPDFLQAFLSYFDELSDPEFFDVWNDIAPVLDRSLKHTGYPTQKPSELAERMIRACTKDGDLVLDCFIGSGTTAYAAQKLGRRWIGCDINKGAIQTASKRIQTIMTEQIAAQEEVGRQGQLIPMEKDNAVKPAQLSFAVYRVNDYDLQIQHNEAVNLACDHIGVTRSRTDAYFDGILGKRLAKIIPFGHPLTLLDLEELKKELAARPTEERDVVLVCLGKETAADIWLEDWNRIRRKGEVPNRIEVIELRTDPKYGKFFVHHPSKAKVNIQRDGDKVVVEIQDFISPSIIERLKGQSGILSPQINDWRSMVDCVMIDSTYDGSIFNITFSDVPEKKNDLVTGKYEFPAPDGRTTVAAKIIDMLGEEVLITKEV